MSDQPDMFAAPARRKANENDPTPLDVVLLFTADEFAVLKVNTPGPSGQMGGYPRFENKLIRFTVPVRLDGTTMEQLQCPLEPVEFARCVRYCLADDQGGPNERIRSACIPALRRIGIDLRRRDGKRY